MKKLISIYFESNNGTLINVLKDQVLPRSDDRLWQAEYACETGITEENKYYLAALLYFNEEADRINFRSILGPFNGLSGHIIFADSWHDEKNEEGIPPRGCQGTYFEELT